MSEEARSSPAQGEVSLTELAGILLRWRRFVAGGLLASWALVLAAAYGLDWVRAEATLAMPPVAYGAIETFRGTYPFADRSGNSKGDPLVDLGGTDVEALPMSPEGFPVAQYRKLVQALRDTGAVAGMVKGGLDPKALRVVRERGDQLIRPVTAGAAKRQPSALDKDDRIVAVAVEFDGLSRTRGEQVVTALCDVIRDTVADMLASDYVAFRRSALAAALQRSERRREQLTSVRASLELLARDLGRLPAVPAAAGAPREIVSLEEGGYRFLPLPVQIAGVRATQAASEHTLRLLERDNRLNAQRLRWLEGVAAALQDARRQGRSGEAASLLARSPAALEGADETEQDVLKQEAEATTRALQALRDSMRYVQAPTTRIERPRLLLASLGAILSALVLAVPFMAAASRRLSAVP
jgi:hypothetical protein